MRRGARGASLFAVGAAFGPGPASGSDPDGGGRGARRVCDCAGSGSRASVPRVGASRAPAEVNAEGLAPSLGPNAARAAVRTFSDRVLGCRPDEISLADAPKLLQALRPMLRTLLGQAPAEVVVAEIEEALR